MFRHQRLVAVAAVLALAALTTGLLLEGVVRGVDDTVSRWAYAHAHGAWEYVLPPMTYTGQRGFVVLPLLVLTVLAMRRTRSIRPLAVFVGALLATALLVGTMKIALGRTAPGAGEDVFGSGGLSYPSGHAVNTILIWTLFMRILVGLYGERLRLLRHAWARAAVVVVIALANAVGMVGLNYHWVSDALAGWLIGLALAMLTPSPLPAWYGRESDDVAARSGRAPSRPVPSA